MPKTSSDNSSDGDEVADIETTNISPSVENYCKATFKWVSLLSAEIVEISLNPSKYAPLLKDLEDVLAALDDEEYVMKLLDTIEVKLRKADVENKLKKSSVTTPPNPSKKRRTTYYVQLPICKSKGVLNTLENIGKFVDLFQSEAIRLNEKIVYVSADVSRIYQLEKDVNVSKEILLKTRENLKKLINKMKASVANA